TTVETRGSARNRAVTWPTTVWASGSELMGARWSTTTTCRALAPRPAKSRWIRLRAATDWLVGSCQPAPARADWTRGAKKPNATITTAQLSSTARRWVAVQARSRAMAPGLAEAGSEAVCGLGRASTTVMAGGPPRRA